MKPSQEQKPYRPRTLIAIRSTDDLDNYVKEAEMLTKHRGRRFLVGSEHKPKMVYRIAKNPFGYDVQKVAVTSIKAVVQLFSPEDLDDAIGKGLVFTHPLRGGVPALARVQPSLDYPRAA